ncbi:beta-1,3-glucan-binding protein-like [Diabrotica virgifera virgifera]|uniref:Beta-1,3-glucan-binding protein-like n=1 Tax=Diabrotica virgifera virgifera TaxID=50390 RepID=A0A6P7F903_DIAVI|nr:beta-1,3-glucan-binding protein-like [Diabrotica virgifera virgifera]
MFKLILQIVLISIFYSTVYCKHKCEKSITTVFGTKAPKGFCSGDVIFNENFDTFELETWEHERTLGGRSHNDQFQWYLNNRSNSFVRDGILHIKPTLLADDRGEDFLYNGTLDLNKEFPNQGCTSDINDGCVRTGNSRIILNPTKSARIHTNRSFSFKYGRVEAKVKVPLGDWLWPALWMMPRENHYSSWPVSGEIDILESRGNSNFLKDGINIGVEQVGSTLIYGPSKNVHRYPQATINKQKGWHKEFHTYELYWNTTSITFSIDKQVLSTTAPPEGGFWELGKFPHNMKNPWAAGTKMAPFDREFYFIINVAIGGTSYFPDQAQNDDGYAKPWKNSDGRASMTKFWKAKHLWMPTWNMTTDSSHFQIDYIKVYAL